ncbi:putative mannose-6-phosphate isomerase ManA [Asanoa ishikariensis]|uniref:mannose-6-phosphate isomerase n=1 Tax=Asanoa ishikariensis TaxID=137265 RepID=A0A1H3MF76_9ACTN|nr:mannose-6-phosphate isomerase, class I [Asanoa ishikariensis]GIF66078.1 putative mannose-6-phosphate isomerase ManA [Asanoa ishikariensis]SDY74964.1 mannose-6-phosphate isomerase, type 1 [Asanoa ishikariensis]
MERLDSPIRDYAWGSRTVLARLQGRTAPSAGPEAELWVGAHPAAPSTLDGEDGPVSLADAIGAAPTGWLGADTVARFGPRLPFLLKLLAADAPLSLQAHPDLERASERFTAGDPNYVDANHKPELLVAIEPFDALCGFRDPRRSADALEALGGAPLAPIVEHLRRGEIADAVELLLTWSGNRTDLIKLITAGKAGEPMADEFADDLALVRRLAADYPSDPGVLVALLLNHVRLTSGDAVWMPAGNLHSYLSGSGIEIMAASDNVLRGGLTPKRVDVGELLQVLRFDVLDEPVVKPIEIAQGVHTWPVPVDDFALHRVTRPTQLSLSGPILALCTAGEITIGDATGVVSLTPGRAAVGPAGAGPLMIAGAGEVYVASLGD